MEHEGNRIFPSWRDLLLLMVVLAPCLVAGCASSAPHRPALEQLDERTGATVTRVSEPFVFYSEDPSLAANVRDYVYLAPLAVNQSGKLTRWLWLGMWSTIDRGATIGDWPAEVLAGIVIMADGEPMEWNMDEALAMIPGVSAPRYETPVTAARHIYLPLSASQLARMARAGTLELYTRYADTTVRPWEVWSGRMADLRAPARDQ